MNRLIAFVILFFIGVNFHIKAQEVYTQLRDPKEVQCFTEVSNALVCQCGCNQVLSLCSHVDCPFAIPARRFIENRIKKGDLCKNIIHSFEKGYSSEIYKDPYAQSLIEKGYKDFIDNLEKGYGPKVLAQHSLLMPIFILIFALLLASLIISLWYKSNRK